MLWLDGELSTTAALFDTQMTNARISDSFNPTLQALAGNIEVKGLQLGVSGYLGRTSGNHGRLHPSDSDRSRARGSRRIRSDSQHRTQSGEPLGDI